MTDQKPSILAEEGASRIKELSGIDSFDVAVVLGSGWSNAAFSLGALMAELPFTDVPGLRQPVAPGHRGILQVREFGGRSILVFEGRTHLYEGHGCAAVTQSIKIASALGVTRLLLTNANGCYHPEWSIGSGVVITDHLNMTGANPLNGSRFLDLQNCWDKRLGLAALERFPELKSGTYALMTGPEYQTPAEGRMLLTMGADVVGMSSVLEAITATDLNMQVFGLSVVTSSELTGVETDPDEVVAAAEAAATRMGAVLSYVISLD